MALNSHCLYFAQIRLFHPCREHGLIKLVLFDFPCNMKQIVSFGSDFEPHDPSLKIVTSKPAIRHKMVCEALWCLFSFISIQNEACSVKNLSCPLKKIGTRCHSLENIILRSDRLRWMDNLGWSSVYKSISIYTSKKVSNYPTRNVERKNFLEGAPIKDENHLAFCQPISGIQQPPTKVEFSHGQPWT